MLKNPKNETIVYIGMKIAIKLWGRVAQWANDEARKLKAVSSNPRRSNKLYTPTHVGKNGESDAAKHNKQMEASVAVKHH